MARYEIRGMRVSEMIKRANSLGIDGYHLVGEPRIKIIRHIEYIDADFEKEDSAQDGIVKTGFVTPQEEQEQKFKEQFKIEVAPLLPKVQGDARSCGDHPDEP